MVLCVALPVSVIGCGHEYGGPSVGPPLGLELTNFSKSDITSAKVTLKPGGSFDFGRIRPRSETSDRSSFRAVFIHGLVPAVFDLRFANGRVRHIRAILDNQTLGSVQCDISDSGPVDSHVLTTDPYDEWGWLLNDTPQACHVRIQLNGDNLPLVDARLEPYSYMWLLPYDKSRRSKRDRGSAKILVKYATGKARATNFFLDNREELCVIVHAGGNATVWRNPKGISP
jgi:hypothetical protein